MGAMHLRIEIEEADRRRLADLARDTGRSEGHLAAEAIAAYLDLSDWQAAAVARGVASLDAGRAIDHAELRAWVESWGRDDEAPAPTSG
jgi:predicted transcriptional regulator